MTACLGSRSRDEIPDNPTTIEHLPRQLFSRRAHTPPLQDLAVWRLQLNFTPALDAQQRVPQALAFWAWETGILFLPVCTRLRPTGAQWGIEKPMKEIAAGVKVASAFPGSISQEPARSAPSSSYDW